MTDTNVQAPLVVALPSSKLPASSPVGTRLHLNLKGRHITLIALPDESVRAVDSACYHSGGPLGAGVLDIEDLQLTCPHHNHKIDLKTGAAVAGGGVVIPRAQRVHVCKREGDQLIVEIENEAATKCSSDRYARNKHSVWTDVHWRDIKVIS